MSHRFLDLSGNFPRPSSKRIKKRAMRNSGMGKSTDGQLGLLYGGRAAPARLGVVLNVDDGSGCNCGEQTDHPRETK